MSEHSGSDPLGDIFTMFAAPVAGTLRTVEQFRRGVDEFLRGVENFNTTMENLNETTSRINALIADVEAPLRAAIPQITRSVKTADEMMKVVSGPAMAVAPGLTRLAETLTNPAFNQLPNQLSQFNDVLAEVSKRLAPLAQMAGGAGGFLGGLRFPGFMSAPTSESTDNDRSLTVTPTPTRLAPTQPAPTKPAAKPSTAKRSTAKKSTAKRSTAKKSAAKRSTAKKSTARRTPS